MARAFIPYDDLGILDSTEEILSTMDLEGNRKWIYPTPSKGRFYWQRLIMGWALIALFVALPIVKIGGQPAVLLDFVRREFALFGLTFYPTDTFLLLLIGLASLVFIFLLTSLLGRVWCGWGCPQTVYLEFVFRPIERWIEGKEHVRARRNAGPWTFDRIWRRTATLSIYVAISVALAHVFVSYFVGWEQLLTWMTAPPTEQWGFFMLMAVTSGLVFFDFAYFREQMCTITCPYARLQSVLVDEDSLIVSYDPVRGEPRARRSKKTIRKEEAGEIPAQGDCIDCYACVRTCPTGIDIRDGLQMECIACTQCIDACDDIMDKIDKPRGLIRYTSERALDRLPTRIVRPRTVIYAGLFVALAVMLGAGVASREAYEVNLARAVGEPFVTLPDGRIANRLRFRVHNRTSEAATYRIEALEPDVAEVRVVGVQPVALEPLEMKRTETWIVVPPDIFAGSDRKDAVFRLVFEDGATQTLAFPLLGPSGIRE